MPEESNAAFGKRGSIKTILLAEGGERLRQSVSDSLIASGYHLIVATGGQEALQKAIEFKGPIHMLLANVEMPDMTGIELARRISRNRPDTNIFLVSNLNSGMLILNNGWHFLPTPFASDMLKARIRDILKEPQWPTKHQSFDQGLSGQVRLSNRETQVLKLIAAGNSTKESAAILGIAFKTCVGHRVNLMKKLDIHDSVNLTRYAIRAGLSDA
jgi:DNA-binding NarL/FixJ family response regulator